MTHHDDDMPQLIPEAEPIGKLQLSIDNAEAYEEWFLKGWPAGTIEHLITVDPIEPETDADVCFRIAIDDDGESPGYAAGRMTLSLFLQAAEIIRAHYQPTVEGLITQGETT